MEISIEGCGSGMLACLHKAMMNQDTVELKFKAKVFGIDYTDMGGECYDVWADVAKIGSVVLVTDEEKATLRKAFPELVESEDEKVRKELFAVINDLVLPKEQLERFNAYLEKVKDFDKQLEEAYKNSDEVQYKRGYDAAMREITYTERDADAKTIRELQERIKELSQISVTKKSEHDGKKWIDEKVYWKEREELFEDGKQEVINNPMKYGLIKPYC